MSSFIGTTEFIQNLDNWLFRADQKNADFLFRHREKIPSIFRSYTKPLYRAAKVNVEFFDRIEKTSYTELPRYTSWSKDRAAAIRFVDDPAFMNSSKEGTKILLTKNIAQIQQVIDIESFVLFMGVEQLVVLGFDETSLDSAIKEKEVLIAPKLKIQKKDVSFL